MSGISAISGKVTTMSNQLDSPKIKNFAYGSMINDENSK